jgi:HSP20 family protein
MPETSDPFDILLSEIFKPVNTKKIKIETQETEAELIITAEVPGVAEENISIEYQNDYLTIKAERKEEKSTYSERLSGKFERSIYIDTKIDDDNIKAELKNGELKITLPKVKNKKITIIRP